MGNRDWARLMAGNAADAQFLLGDWDDVLVTYDQLLGGRIATMTPMSATSWASSWPSGRCAAVVDEMAHDVARFELAMGDTDASQERTVALQVRMWLAMAAGRDAELMRWSVEGAEPLNGLLCHHIVGHVALWNRDLTRARAALAGWSARACTVAGPMPCSVDLGAGIAALEGDADSAAAGLDEATATLRDLGARLTLAMTLIDRVILASDAASASAAAAEARSLLHGLRARALEDRLDALLASRAPEVRDLVPRPTPIEVPVTRS